MRGRGCSEDDVGKMVVCEVEAVAGRDVGKRVACEVGKDCQARFCQTIAPCVEFVQFSQGLL